MCEIDDEFFAPLPPLREDTYIPAQGGMQLIVPVGLDESLFMLAISI